MSKEKPSAFSMFEDEDEAMKSEANSMAGDDLDATPLDKATPEQLREIIRRREAEGAVDEEGALATPPQQTSGATDDTPLEAASYEELKAEIEKRRAQMEQDGEDEEEFPALPPQKGAFK
jgi:hypothetical protein